MAHRACPCRLQSLNWRLLAAASSIRYSSSCAADGSGERQPAGRPRGLAALGRRTCGWLLYSMGVTAMSCGWTLNPAQTSAGRDQEQPQQNSAHGNALADTHNTAAWASMRSQNSGMGTSRRQAACLRDKPPPHQHMCIAWQQGPLAGGGQGAPCGETLSPYGLM